MNDKEKLEQIRQVIDDFKQLDLTIGLQGYLQIIKKSKMC